MEAVTDVVFRHVVASAARPDVFFTEFVNASSFCSVKGRHSTNRRLLFAEDEKPIVAQIWGTKPDEFAKMSVELAKIGFSGIDINMGCPDKTIVKNGCCSALINDRDLAVAIIAAVKKGVNGRVPVSVKIRTGWNEVDFSWPELILKQGIDMLSVHGRTTKEMSKVPARWEDIAAIAKIRDRVAPATLIVGNGDVESREHGEMLAKKYKLDGIMIGRAIFTDPYIFSKKSPWVETSEKDRLKLFKKHIELFQETYQNRERNWQGLKRMAKVYVHGIENASLFRDQLMRSETLDGMLKVIESKIG